MDYHLVAVVMMQTCHGIVSLRFLWTSVTVALWSDSTVIIMSSNLYLMP